MNYRLTDAAREDIRDIVGHMRIHQKSPQNARLVALRLKAQFQRLVKIPNLGYTREQLRDNHALVVAVTGVLVIYDPWLKPLTILRIVYGSRDLNRIDPR